MVLAIAAEFDFECCQLDYNTAFLNAKVEEEVYVKMAPGYEESNDDGVPMVVWLIKSLYGLRQSPRCWYGTVDEYVEGSVSKASSRTPASTSTPRAAPSTSWTLYVDDALLLGKYSKVLEHIKRKLMGRFSMTDMRDMSLVFGMEVARDRTKGTVTVTKENYVKSLLERYGMGNCNPAYTPGAGK